MIDDTLAQIADIARVIWELGWAERNAGNLSLDVTGDESCARSTTVRKVIEPIHTLRWPDARTS